MKKILASLVMVMIAAPSIAHADSFTMSTYYPAPFGRYEQVHLDRLRFEPIIEPVPCEAGTFFLSQSYELMFCGPGGVGTHPGVWTQVDVGVGGPEPDHVYLTNLNRPLMNVGIGKSDPQGLLDVKEILVVKDGGNVGIGKTDPQGLLDVKDILVVKDDGNVGIGTQSPRTTVHIESTDAMIIPSGDGFGQRPSCNSSIKGATRFNTSSDDFEGCTGSQWVSFGNKGKIIFNDAVVETNLIQVGYPGSGWGPLDGMSMPVTLSQTADVSVVLNANVAIDCGVLADDGRKWAIFLDGFRVPESQMKTYKNSNWHSFTLMHLLKDIPAGPHQIEIKVIWFPICSDWAERRSLIVTAVAK